MFSVAVIYGISYFITKTVVPEFIQPFGAILIRVFFATLLFIIAHSLSSKEKIDKKDYPKFIAAAFFGVALNQLMFFKGLSITTPINASLIMTTTPILVMILSALILGEKITWKKILGIGMGLTGAILLLGGTNFSFQTTTIWGDLAILTNALSYGAYLIVVKPLMKKYEALTVVRWVFTFGFIIIIPFGFNEMLAIPSSSFTLNVFLGMAFIILFTTFLAYLLNAWALRFVNPSVVGFYIYIQPILATFITLFLGKDLNIIHTLIQSALIFIGVYLVSKK